MASKLEIMKMKVEILATTTAKADLEYKIMQREEEIEKIRENLVLQDLKLEEMKAKLADVEK